jgi:hypothetical protein
MVVSSSIPLYLTVVYLVVVYEGINVSCLFEPRRDCTAHNRAVLRIQCG